MKKYIFLSLILFVSNNLFGQKTVREKISDYLEDKVKTNDFSGAVLVAKHNKILFSKAYGLANKELNVKNTLQTKFKIGSITKQFTAAAILKLVEEKKIKLEDKLSAFYPNYPKGDQITIHMLMNHSSGIKNYTSLPLFATLSTLPLSKDSLISVFKNESLDFVPGSNWKYSNSGYFLLGCIVEKVSKQSFNDFIIQYLINPSQLKNTLLDKSETILPNRANGYSRAGDKWQNADYISMELPFSAGAMISTVGDLFLWNKTLYAEKILSKPILQKMTSQYLGKYGYGLFVDTLFHQQRFGHTGGIPGFISQNDYYPKEKLHVIVLANFNAKSDEIAKDLANILIQSNLK